MESTLAPAHVHAVESRAVDDRPGALVRLTRRIAAAADVRDYVTFDRRTLGLSRILLGYLLIGDLFHRGRWWLEMYSNEGVLPIGAAPRPVADEFSIFNAFATPGELRLLFALMLATFVCLLVGYRTRVAQVLALIFVTGMNSRVLLTETMGYVAENLLVLWTLPGVERDRAVRLREEEAVLLRAPRRSPALSSATMRRGYRLPVPR